MHNVMFPENGTVSSADFDVSLMICLLRHFHIRQQPRNGYETLPCDQDKNPADDLARIKYYRNLVAHSNDGKMDEAGFKVAWKNLSEAIGRLGDPLIKQQCDILERLDLNTEYKSLFEEVTRNIKYLESKVNVHSARQDAFAEDIEKQEKLSRENENIIKQLLADLRLNQEKINKTHEDNIKQLRLELNRMTERLNSNLSPVPRNVKAKIVRQIEEWIKDAKKYVIIDAASDAIELLKTHKSVTVTGNAGCGKTALIHHVALHFMKEGYDIIPVLEPRSIANYHDETKKQVFILDDACGIHAVDCRKRVEWKDYSKIIEDGLKNSDAILMISVRLTVFNDKQFRDIALLNETVINLNSQKHILTYGDRVKIFNSYFERTYTELGISDKSFLLHDAFPLICRLATTAKLSEEDRKTQKNEHSNLNRLFESPDLFLEGEITSLQIESPLSYCALFLCVLFNGKMPRQDLFNSKKYKSLISDCCESCGLNRSTSRQMLSDTIARLKNVYLKEVDGKIWFIHDVLMDVIARHIGTSFPRVILRHADIEFICERIRLKFCQSADFGNMKIEETAYTILIEQEYYNEFFERLFIEIKNGNAWQVFNHCQTGVLLFQQALSDFLETKSNEELEYAFLKVNDLHSDHQQKIRLKFFDKWISVLETKPFEVECHSFMYLVASNGIQWILGRGLHVLLSYLEKRIAKSIHKEIISNKNICRFIIILGGCANIYSWFKTIDIRNIRIFNFHSNRIDLLLSVRMGQVNIVSYLLKQDNCCKYLKEDVPMSDVILVDCSLLNMSVLELNWQLLFARLLFQLTSLFQNRSEVEYSLENILNFTIGFCEFFFTEDETFNTLIIKKYHAELVPVIRKQYEHRLEYATSPLPETVFSDAFDRLKLRMSYLEIAAMLGHDSVVNVLLLKGVDPNYKCRQRSRTAEEFSAVPIIRATMYGRRSIVEILLCHGANIKSTGVKGCTLLMFASSYGHLKTVLFLLEKGAEVNLQNIFKNTALFYASKKGHTKIVNVLLSNGADPNIVCHKGKTALIEAASGGHTDVVRYLLMNNASANVCDERNMTALIKAALSGHFTIVKLLLNNHADFSHSVEKKTALLFAACKGHLSVISTLLNAMEKRARSSIENFGDTDQHSSEKAEYMHDFSHLPFFTFHSIATIYKDELNKSLIIAFYKKRIDIMETVLKCGVNVNTIDPNYGMSLINIASKKGYYDAVHLFLHHGASVHHRKNLGVSPLILASLEGHSAVVELLLQNGADVNSTSVRLAIGFTYLETVLTQNRKGTHHNIAMQQCDSKCTALICAIESRSFEVVEVLLQEKSINVNAKTSMGRTALMIACGHQDNNIVNMLIRYKANVNIISEMGLSALDIASIGNTQIIKTLIENGATVSGNNILMPTLHDLKTCDTPQPESRKLLVIIICVLGTIVYLLLPILLASTVYAPNFK